MVNGKRNASEVIKTTNLNNLTTCRENVQ